MKIIEETLANGLTVILVPIPGAKTVCEMFGVRAGWKYEHPEIYGISRFIEHMMFRGTAKRSGIKRKMNIGPIVRYELEGLPEGHEVEYLGRIDSDTYVIVYRPEKDWNYTDFQVKIGPKENLEEVKVIKEVTRLRDGGTTIIETAKGTLYFPSPFFKDRIPTFNSQPIELLEVVNYGLFPK